MAMKVVTSLFAGYEEAVAAVRDLEEAGFLVDDITVLPPQFDQGEDDIGIGGGLTAGAIVGSAIGGAAGLLAGLGEIALPGIGALTVAGWLATALLSAAIGACIGGGAGGAAGALTNISAKRDVSRPDAEATGAVGALLTIRVEADSEAAAQAILARHHAADPGETAPQRHGAMGQFGYRRAFQTAIQRRDEQRAI